MTFFAASEAPPRPESMKFPVNSLLAGNLAFSETSSQLTPPSSGESPANLSFRRIEVQGRSREADGDSRGGEHQGRAAVQQLTASPAADARIATKGRVWSESQTERTPSRRTRRCTTAIPAYFP